jgi:hypothetical protein
MLPGHIVTTGGLPGLVGWLVAAVLAGSAAVAVLGRSPRLRIAGLVAAIAAGSTTVALWILTPLAPSPPGYALRFGSPVASAAVSSPVDVEVCGRMADGTSAAVPGPGRLVSMSVDGRQVAERAGGTLILEITPGSHRIRAEVLTADHRQFSPPLAIETSVVVVGLGVLTTPPPC